MSDTTDTNRGWLREEFIPGLKGVLWAIWQVPATRSWVATQLIRWGVPAAIVAIGMAAGETLAH